MYLPINYLVNVEDITSYYQDKLQPLFLAINTYFEKHQTPVPDVLSSFEKGLREAVSDPNTHFMTHFDYNYGKDPIKKTDIIVHGIEYLRTIHTGVEEAHPQYSLTGMKDVISLITSKDSVSASIYKRAILSGENELIMEYDRELSLLIQQLFITLHMFAMLYDKGRLRYLEKPYYTFATGRVYGHLKESLLNNKLYGLWDKHTLSFMDKMFYHFSRLVDELKQREYHLDLTSIVDRDTNKTTAIKLVDPDTGNFIQHDLEDNFFAFSYQGHYYEYSDDVPYPEDAPEEDRVLEPSLEYMDPNKVCKIVTKENLSIPVTDPITGHEFSTCYAFTDYHQAIKTAIRYITNNIIPRG